MSQVVLDVDELDAFVRERIDTVLVGKWTKTSGKLHIPEEPGSTESACRYSPRREDGWRDKDIRIYPPHFHGICTRCVNVRFGVEVER